MKAVLRSRYGPPQVLELSDLPRPIPVGDEVLVRVQAASLNTADLDQLLGRPLAARLATGLSRPRQLALGLDLAGTVEAVGPDTTVLRPGDEVWGDLFGHGQGTFAQYVCAPERAFHPKPAGIGFTEAAAVPHSGTLALQAIAARGPIRPGEEMLVNGAGGCVGPFAIQIAKALGAVVTGVDHTAKLDLMRKAGADHVIDYTETNVTRHRRRYDVVVDIAANRSPLGYLSRLTPEGRYVQISRTLGGFVSAAILGGAMTALTRRRMGVFTWVPNRRQDLDALGRLITDGKLLPLIDRAYPLAEIQAAFRRMGEGGGGKVVILANSRVSGSAGCQPRSGWCGTLGSGGRRRFSFCGLSAPLWVVWNPGFWRSAVLLGSSLQK